MPECPSAQVPKCPPSAFWVPSECPSAPVLSECLKCSSALWLSLNVRPMPEYLIRCDWNEMLSIKRCFDVLCICKKKKSERWFGKLLKLVLDILFLWRLNLTFCVGTFKRSVRVALMILTLTLNKKRSSAAFFWRMFCAFPVIRVFDGRAFFVSFSVPPLYFIENHLVRHRISLFCSRDHMMTQFG